MFPVSCMWIWWNRGNWISEKLRFDYLKNEKCFRSESLFLVSQVISFRLTKQTRKNVTDTTFMVYINAHFISSAFTCFLFVDKYVLSWEVCAFTFSCFSSQVEGSKKIKKNSMGVVLKRRIKLFVKLYFQVQHNDNIMI